jgi:hypothetical protein
MHASELVAQLQKLISAHGDFEVGIDADDFIRGVMQVYLLKQGDGWIPARLIIEASERLLSPVEEHDEMIILPVAELHPSRRATNSVKTTGRETHDARKSR